jgi:hypothetical protein
MVVGIVVGILQDKEDADIDSYLASLGLVRKRIPKDGACLFRAVSEHIYQTQVCRSIIIVVVVAFISECVTLPSQCITVSLVVNGYYLVFYYCCGGGQ